MILSEAAAFAQGHFFALRAAALALGTRNDVDHLPTAVHARLGIGAMAEVRRARPVVGKAHAGDGMVRTAFGRLRSIASHSNYHMAENIQDFGRLGKTWGTGRNILAKCRPMYSRKALRADNTPMCGRSVAFMNFETIGRVLRTQPSHETVALHLCRN